MVELLRAAVFDDEPKLCNHKFDWMYIYQKSVEQNISGLLFCSISKINGECKPSPDILEKFKNSMLQTMVIMGNKYNEFLRMQKLLVDKEIKFVGLKGCRLRNIYPVPELRTMGDFDVLVETKDLKMVSECFRENGYTVEKDLFGLVAKNTKAYWEIFTSLEEEFQINTDYNNELIINNSIKVNGEYLLEHTYFLAHVIIHTGKHYIERGAGIRNLCDIALYIDKYKGEINFDLLEELCKEQNYEKIYNYILNVMEQKFKLDISFIDFKRVNCDDFVEYTFINGVFGRTDNVLLRQVSLDENNDTRGLRRLFFPSAKTLENRYKYLKKTPYLLPVAWVQRIIYGRIGKKVKFSRMLSDINGALKFSDERLQWLKKLGLNDKH
jgi:hypothetical protein